MDELALTCEKIASYTSRLKKVALLADYLRPLSNLDFERAVRFLCCGPIQSGDHKFSVCGATLREAASSVLSMDPKILSICYAEVGDTGETIGLLLHGVAANEPLSLSEAELFYARLYKMRKTADKVELLKEIYLRHRPITIKYFIKVITGNLRIGLLAKQVEEAIAVSTGAPHEEIRLANNRIGDLPKIALAARTGTLHELEARLFHPMDFMLAKPLEVLDDLADPENWWVEDKYDGFRSQVHAERGDVRIFTRGMEEVTKSFPEIVDAAKKITGSAVLDGEVLAWSEGRALSFSVLQQRIARKKLTPSIVSDVPVSFIAYDILYRDGRMLIDVPIEERRAILESALEGVDAHLMVSPRMTASTTGDIDRFFADARNRGNEGLVIKRRGGLYEPGKRSGGWQKIKRPYGTLDVVVTAAEQGHGRRAIWLSDYTFGVRDGERFVNVGKAYSGLTDAEIRELTRLLRSATLERFGRVALVRPEVVLEVAFDGVQKSSRHKGGYALRFPRILRWRKDKTPDDCDTLDRVRQMYEDSLRTPALPA